MLIESDRLDTIKLVGCLLSLMYVRRYVYWRANLQIFSVNVHAVNISFLCQFVFSYALALKNVIHISCCWSSSSWQSIEAVCCWWHFWRCCPYCGSRATCSNFKKWYMGTWLFHLNVFIRFYENARQLFKPISQNMSGQIFWDAVRKIHAILLVI